MMPQPGTHPGAIPLLSVSTLMGKNFSPCSTRPLLICRNMEVGFHPPPDRRTAGEAAPAAAEVTVINGEGDARFPKVFREKCMRLRRPQRYDDRGDAQVLDEFVPGLRTYLHL